MSNTDKIDDITKNDASSSAASSQDNTKSKASAALDKGKAFMGRHNNIWQIIKFTFISLIAFIAEFASMYALQYGLEDTLVSKCIAEIISFTINRKKTFNANNNIVFSAIAYVLTVIALILFTTWMAGALGDAIGPHIGADWGNTISKLLGSFISWVVMFLMDKFVIMRKIDKKGPLPDDNPEASDN